MNGAERGGAVAAVLSEKARIASRQGQFDVAQQAIDKLSEYAATSAISS